VVGRSIISASALNTWSTIKNGCSIPEIKMANILIVDDQAWIKELCREGLTGEGYNIFATDNIEAVTEDISYFEPHVVLLNQYLKHGFFAWDVLKEIKNRNPNLPVLVVTIHDTHLKCPQLSMADGYVVKSHMAGKELRQKISALLRDQTSIADEPLTAS
jgi:DNA-binding NtrC family response regulator